MSLTRIIAIKYWQLQQDNIYHLPLGITRHKFRKNSINTYAFSFSGAGLLADDGKGWGAVEKEKEDVCLDVQVTEGALLGLKVNKKIQSIIIIINTYMYM